MTSSRRTAEDGRAVAYRVLARVDADAAFAAVALDAELVRASLDDREARLASAIVYGALRHRAALDALVDARRTTQRALDPRVRAVLRAAAFQLGGLDRTPPHAVVAHAVEAVRRDQGPKVAGFVNAVLRALSREGVALATTLPLDPALVSALRESVPAAVADALLAPDAEPAVDLRAREGTRDAVLASLAGLGRGEVTPTRFAPLGIRTRRVGDPRKLPGFDEGAFVVQDEGSQLAAELLAVQPGERVLDACAGRGGKTLRLAERAGASGRVVAVDRNEARVERIPAAARRLSLPVPEALAIDWTVGDGGLGATFDAVLVDAPCSGVGTLRRRPELAARLDADTVAELVALQQAIATRVATLVAPGARLVYVVCSPLRVELEAASEAFRAAGLSARPFTLEEAAGLPVRADGSLALGPHVVEGAEMDAYQAIRFVRV